MGDKTRDQQFNNYQLVCKKHNSQSWIFFPSMIESLVQSSASIWIIEVLLQIWKPTRWSLKQKDVSSNHICNYNVLYQDN